MKLRAFVLDANTIAKFKALRARAEKADKWYFVGKSSFVPGDLDYYVEVISGVKCVFSITGSEGITGWHFARHASFSIIQGHPELDPDSDATPNPLAAFTLAGLLGFTGGELAPSSAPEDDEAPVILSPAKDWQIGVQDSVVILAQVLTLAELAELGKGEAEGASLQ